MKRSLQLMRLVLKESWDNQASDGSVTLRHCRNLQAMQSLAMLKISLPNMLHFVWIGDPAALDYEYILIWQQVNRDKEVILWYDKDCSLCHRFHKLLTQHAKKTTPNHWQQRLTELQNEAFHYIYPRLDKALTFDILARQFLQHLDIEIKIVSQPAIFSDLTERRSIHHLFSGKFAKFEKYYYYEIILRGNLASASDIARLLILYHYGGIYIDTDTLPGIITCFPETHSLLKHYGISANEYAISAVAEAFLQKTRNTSKNKRNIYFYIKKIPDISLPIRKKLYSTIKEEAQNISLASIPPLGNVRCYPNLIIQSAVPYLSGIYFSNVLGACPGSRTIAILLRSIDKRYRYLKNNNAIFTCIDEDCAHHYLARLLIWRHESIAKSGEVTLALTGPGLIVEVLLGLGYHLLKLNEDIPPSFLSTFMQNNHYGIAFFDHTLHTPAGLISTWMK